MNTKKNKGTFIHFKRKEEKKTRTRTNDGNDNRKQWENNNLITTTKYTLK